MFSTDADVQSLMAAALKVSSFGALPPYWTTIVQRAHQAAYNEIRMALMRRGFNPAQIAAWDSGVEYELWLSCWWCCVFGGGFQNYDPTWVRELNRRKNDLSCVEVSNAGVWQPPGIGPPTGPGQAFAGSQDRYASGFSPLPDGGCGVRWFGSCGINGESCNGEW